MKLREKNYLPGTPAAPLAPGTPYHRVKTRLMILIQKELTNLDIHWDPVHLSYLVNQHRHHGLEYLLHLCCRECLKEMIFSSGLKDSFDN